MTQLVLATNNKGKLAELQQMLPGFKLLSLEEIGFTKAIPEPYETFEENAEIKARTVFNASGMHTLSDDSGLCVPALGNAPGVHSAYFGGEPRSDSKNNRKLLEELAGEENRAAFYKCIICLIWNGQPYYFEGKCEGRIADEPQGDGGFGYDPLFIPEGYDQTFGQLSSEVKKELSHRGKAIRKMVSFLEKQLAL